MTTPTKPFIDDGKGASIFRQIFAVLIVNLSTLATGGNIGISGPVLPQLRDDVDIKMSEDEGSWFVSLASITSIPMTILGAVLSDRIGRKKTILLSTIPTFAGWVTMAFAANTGTILGGRILTGFISLGTCTVQVYVAECSEVHLKGLFGSFFLCISSLGVLITYVLGTYLPWRVVCGSCSVPLVFLFLALFFIPESPPWLLSKGKLSEAFRSLRRLRGLKHNVQPEMTTMIVHRPEQNEPTPKQNFFRKIWTSGALRPLAILGVIFFWQQCSGAYVVIYYAADVFSKLPGVEYHLGTVLVGTVRVLFTFVGIVVIKYSRLRPVTICSGIGMTVTLLAAVSNMYWGSQSNWIPATILVLFVGFATPGVMMVPWILIGEVFPLEIRGAMSNLAACMAGTFSFLSLKTYPLLVNLMDQRGAFALYGAISFAGTLFTFFFMPETKGISLGTIEKDLRERQTKKANGYQQSEQQGLCEHS